MKTFSLIAFALVSLCGGASPRDQNLSELPAYIKPPDSGLALFADFDHPSEGLIPVYLINRSGQGFLLPSSAEGAGLMLEYQDAAGRWIRAQPYACIGCATGLMGRFALPHNSFFVGKGYRPAEGEPATIRFRLYQDDLELTSNVGPGFINREDVQKARNDLMAVLYGDFAFVASVARGDLVLHDRTLDHGMLRNLAIRELGRNKFERAKAEKVLREIIAAKKEPYRQGC